MNDLVSIVVPTFNSSKFLRDTLDAILAQTYQFWECIVVDDFSSDDTVSIIDEYAASDLRIIPIFLKFNMGPASARNQAISKARGRFISFCDSDDIWLPNKLSSQLDSFLEEKDKLCAVYFASYFKMQEDGKRTSRIVKAEPIVTYDMLLQSNFIGCSTAIYDVNICGKVYMPDILKRQDYGLWLKILQKGYIAKGVSEPLVYYRIRSSSVSSNKFSAALFHWKVLNSTVEAPLYKKIYYFVSYIFLGLKKKVI